MNKSAFCFTTIELFDDRVEISNPDGLVSAISHTEFGKRSHSRNTLIFSLFARMNMVEQIGSGIIRMNDLMKEAGLPEPVFSIEGMFTVTLKRPLKTSEKTSEKTVEKTVEEIVEETVEETVEEIIIVLMMANPKVTAKDMMKATGLSRRGVEYQLNKLKDSGKIERIGSTKGGYWGVKSEQKGK